MTTELKILLQDLTALINSEEKLHHKWLGFSEKLKPVITTADDFDKKRNFIVSAILAGITSDERKFYSEKLPVKGSIDNATYDGIRKRKIAVQKKVFLLVLCCLFDHQKTR